MPDVNAAFPHLEAMDTIALNARYAELTGKLKLLPSGMPDPNATQDDITLQEMCVILSQLRKRSAGPPKKKAPPGTRKAPVPEPTLDQL